MEIMSYLYLAFAIIFEICGTTCMKLSAGLTKPLPSVLIFVFYGISFISFTIALKKIEVSVAYAIWAGLGVAMISAIGHFGFGEPMPPVRIAFLVLIAIGVIGLHLSSSVN
ncbi:small multidrug resistance pump [Methanolobus vulcani]|jgi:small multidrug resistance pump|uniref:Small multidrug resistance pump n=2 Tax=Methanolobus vulcani TaxID=38026 RepID=A0A7Z7AZ83_9EURY|nr:small multidrug resistance pump [Methanolobus vulcani]